MTVVLVCGGRDFDNKTYLESRMEMMFEKRKPDLIVHGGAAGADTMAGKFALAKQCNVMIVPAKWNEHGRSAGPIRNREMLDLQRVDLVVAFPGGTGTKNMIKQAMDDGIEVIDLAEDWKKYDKTLTGA